MKEGYNKNDGKFMVLAFASSPFLSRNFQSLKFLSNFVQMHLQNFKCEGGGSPHKYILCVFLFLI